MIVLRRCPGRLIWQRESRAWAGPYAGQPTGSSVYRCSICGDGSAFIVAGPRRIDGKICGKSVYVNADDPAYARAESYHGV